MKTLKQFANSAGVEVVYRGWAEEKFGAHVASALFKLLETTP